MREPCMMRMGAMLRGEISSLFAVGGARWGLLSIEWRILGEAAQPIQTLIDLIIDTDTIII